MSLPLHIHMLRIAPPVDLSDRLALLPCCVCGEPGPNRPFPTPEDGTLAICAPCEERVQNSGKHVGDAVHGSTVAALPLSA